MEGHKVILKEGERGNVSEHVVVPGHLLEVRTIDNSSFGFASDEVEFRDVLSGNNYGATLTANGTGSVIIDGRVYWLKYAAEPSEDESSYYITLDFPQTSGDIKMTFYCEYEECVNCPRGNAWCVGSDITRDGKVDANDYDVLDRLYLLHKNEPNACSAQNSWCNNSDINRDRRIDANDYDIIDKWSLFHKNENCSVGLNYCVDSQCVECLNNSDCLNGQECVDSQCVEEPVPSICTDTDGGKNYYVKGAAISSTVNGKIFENLVDNCSGTTLQEGYCYDDVPEADYEYYLCPNGCYDGACILPPTNQTCTDSDGGLNYYVKGTTKDSKTTKTDNCWYNKTLIEYYCLNNTAEQFNFNCSGRCVNGACLAGGLRQLLIVNFREWEFEEDLYGAVDDNGYNILYDVGGDRRGIGFVGFLNEAEIDYSKDYVLVQPRDDDDLILKFNDSHSNNVDFRFVHLKNEKIFLADDFGDEIHVREGERVNVSEYVIVGAQDRGDESYILELILVDNSTSGYWSDEVRFLDVLSGNNYNAWLTANGTGEVTIGGRVYGLKYAANPHEDSSSYYVALDYPQSSGDEKIISPPIELANGNSIAIGTLDDFREAYNLDVNGTTPGVLFIEKDSPGSGIKEKDVVLIKARIQSGVFSAVKEPLSTAESGGIEGGDLYLIEEDIGDLEYSETIIENTCEVLGANCESHKAIYYPNMPGIESVEAIVEVPENDFSDEEFKSLILKSFVNWSDTYFLGAILDSPVYLFSKAENNFSQNMSYVIAWHSDNKIILNKLNNWDPNEFDDNPLELFIEKYVLKHPSDLTVEENRCVQLNNEVISKLNELKSENETVVLKEGDKVYEDEFFVVSNNGGKVLEVTSIENEEGYYNDDVVLEDAISGEGYGANVYAEGFAEVIIDGFIYHLKYFGNYSDESYIEVTWEPANKIETFYDCGFNRESVYIVLNDGATDEEWNLAKNLSNWIYQNTLFFSADIIKNQYLTKDIFDYYPNVAINKDRAMIVNGVFASEDSQAFALELNNHLNDLVVSGELASVCPMISSEDVETDIMGSFCSGEGRCDSCGIIGPFFCSRESCLSLSEGCYFIDVPFGPNECNSCSGFTCSDFLEEGDCYSGTCNLDCRWQEGQCTEKVSLNVLLSLATEKDSYDLNELIKLTS